MLHLCVNVVLGLLSYCILVYVYFISFHFVFISVLPDGEINKF